VEARRWEVMRGVEMISIEISAAAYAALVASVRDGRIFITHVRLSSNDSGPGSRGLHQGVVRVQSLFEGSGPASCSMVLPLSTHPTRSALAASASRSSSSEVRQRKVSVRAGSLAVTLS
jgi:hypothetical protein